MSTSHSLDLLGTTPQSAVSDLQPGEPSLPPPAVLSPPIETGGEDATPDGVATRSLLRRGLDWAAWIVSGVFQFFALIFCLAFLAAIPVLQLVAFGYLLDVSGRLAAGGKLGEALPHRQAAGKIALVAIAVFFGSLPVQLLVHWESVAELVSPGSAQAGILRGLAIAAACLGIVYLLWAIARGGTVWNFLWPQPKRMLREAWRPSTYRDLPDQLWEFTGSLELVRYFSLGLRGALGTLVWLTPAFVIILASRNGETGLAGLVGALAFIALGVVLMYLPMLQANFAAENRFRALFDVRRIRRLFCFAPWSWLLALVCGMVLLPIPLYLLKIEATPKEVVWLPTLVFVAFILPARIIEGLALRRAKRVSERYEVGTQKPQGTWHWISRWVVRLTLPAVIGVYLLFVVLSQYTSWEGLQTWVQQHAILIPIPFQVRL